MQIILNSIEEIKSFYSLFKGQVSLNQDSKPEEQKVDIKPTTEKPKKEKAETKKTEQPKEDKPGVEDKKEDETPKVDAEVTGVDTNSNEPVKDAEVTKETNITKEMVRAICSKAIKAGKSAEVKNIVGKYGAAKLPDLKEECYADAYKDVEALL